MKAELGSPVSPLPLTCPHSTPLLNLDLFPSSLPLHPVLFLSPSPLELKPNITKRSLKATFPDSRVRVPHPAPAEGTELPRGCFLLPPGVPAAWDSMLSLESGWSCVPARVVGSHLTSYRPDPSLPAAPLAPRLEPRPVLSSPQEKVRMWVDSLLQRPLLATSPWSLCPAGGQRSHGHGRKGEAPEPRGSRAGERTLQTWSHPTSQVTGSKLLWEAVKPNLNISGC